MNVTVLPRQTVPLGAISKLTLSGSSGRDSAKSLSNLDLNNNVFSYI